MLYVHVPFCRSRCIYCDFYSTTLGGLQGDYLRAVGRELSERADYLPSRRLSTIYIGGGTPSTLGIEGLEQLFGSIEKLFAMTDDCEVTLEANPDDITPEFARALRGLPVNRLSLGVQTFDDGLLRFLRRRHTALGAIRAVEALHSAGFDNLSIDLIYGLPGQTLPLWERDLEQAFSLPIAHLSAYALSYEEGTPLHGLLSEGSVAAVADELSEQLYYSLLDRAESRGWEHYEISNFARPGFHSRHNSGYWADRPYLGVGPSAHSYNLRARRWNTADLRQYISAPTFGEELLTPIDLRNEMVMKRLRTREGLSVSEFTARFGSAATRELVEAAAPHVSAGRLARHGDRLSLTRRGLFVSDGIMADLFAT